MPTNTQAHTPTTEPTATPPPSSPTDTPTATPTTVPIVVPFNLRLEQAVLPPAGTLTIFADITVDGTVYYGVPCLPYVAVTVGSTQYFILSGNKITTKMTPYLQPPKKEGNYFRLYDNISNYQIARIAYAGLAPGRYPVQGALLDNKGRVMGWIAVDTLTIE